MEVKETAEELARQRALVTALGMTNTPSDEAERMRAAIQYEMELATLAVLEERLRRLITAQMTHYSCGQCHDTRTQTTSHNGGEWRQVPCPACCSLPINGQS